MSLIRISVEGESVLGVIANLRQTADVLAKQVSGEINLPTTPAAPAAPAATEAKKRTPKATTTSVPAAPAVPASAPAVAPATTTAPAAAPAAPAPASAPANTVAVATFAEIIDIVPKIVVKYGEPKAIAVLAEFGVKRARELKENQYGPFVARAKAVLEGAN